MKLNVALAALVMGDAVSAFSVNAPALHTARRVRLTQLSLSQNTYPYQQKTYQYQRNEKTGQVQVNGDPFLDSKAAAVKMDADLEALQKASADAKSRVAALQTDLQAKEVKQDHLIAAMKAEMEQQKAEHTQQVNAIGVEAAHIKLQAHTEKMQVIQDFKTREQALQEEMTSLRTKLQEEQDLIELNQKNTSEILQSRLELETSLANLQVQYDNDSKKWQTKLAAERQAHDSDLKRLTAELETHNRSLGEYERTSKDLESKLLAEQEARNREVKKHEEMSKEFEMKLGEELEARKRDFNVLNAEKDAYSRDVTQYVQVSKDLESKLDKKDADFKASQKASAEAMSRLAALQAALRAKEQKQILLAVAMKTEMEKQKQEYKQQVNDIGIEATHIKLQTHKEKMQVVQDFKTREQALQDEMTSLRTNLQEEQDLIELNQKNTSEILQSRLELETSLAELQVQYDNDSKSWQTKLAAAQQEHDSDLKRLTAELEAHNRSLGEYERTSKDLESKLLAEQQARNLDFQKHEEMSKEFEMKLVGELETHKRDFDANLKESQKASAEAMSRLATLQTQLRAKEHKQVLLAVAMKTEMKQQKAEHTQQVNDIGIEATHIKLQAHKEKMQVVQDFNAREQALQDEMTSLRTNLQEEQDLIELNQKNTSEILQSRLKLETSLAKLQEQYDNESKSWQTKLAAAQQEHDIELKRLTAELETHNRNLGEYERTSKDLESKLLAEQQARNLDFQKHEEMSKVFEMMLVGELEAHKRDFNALNAEKDAYSRDVTQYAEVSKDLESKLNAEKEAHNRAVSEYEQKSKELENKLTAELEARKRELDALEAEKDAHSRDLAQVSKELESKLNAEQEAHTLAMSKLNEEQEAHKRDLAAYQEKLVKAQENTNVILKNRIALEQESKELEAKLSAEQNALKANLVTSQQAVSESNELKNKLAAAQEAHTRDLNLLKEEQELLQQGVAEYQEKLKKAQEETSTLLQNRIAMEEESSELGSKLDAANRAHEADLFKSQQAIAELRAAISEMHNEQNVLKKSNLILQKRVEVDGEITSLQRKKDAATKAWQETMEYEIAALKNEADEANAELAWMREREAMRISEEESRLSIGKTFKGVFGRKMN